METGPAAAFLGRERFQGTGIWSQSMDRMGEATGRSWARTVRTLGGLQMLRVQYCDLSLQVAFLLIVNLYQLNIGGENEA